VSDIVFYLGLDVATVAVGNALGTPLAGIDGDPGQSENFFYVPLTRSYFPFQPCAPPSDKYCKISPAFNFFRVTQRGCSSYSLTAEAGL
jgi:hypothetical protein